MIAYPSSRLRTDTAFGQFGPRSSDFSFGGYTRRRFSLPGGGFLRDGLLGENESPFLNGARFFKSQQVVPGVGRGKLQLSLFGKQPHFQHFADLPAVRFWLDPLHFAVH